MQHKGLGSVSYQTGMLQNRRQLRVALNSVAFTVISILSFVLGIFLLFANMSGHFTVSSAGHTVGATPNQTVLFKWIAFVILSLPLMERIWSYLKIEKKVA